MSNLDAFEILVIILSVTLAVFLALAITLTIYLIRVAKKVSEITDKAGNVVDNIETIGRAATSTGPLSFISNIVSTVVEKSLNNEDKEDKDNG